MTSLGASLPVGAAEESTAPSTEASSEAAGTAAVFDETEGTCSGLGLGTDGDMIGADYIIENLNGYITSRQFTCPDASDAEPSAECQVAFIEAEVAAAE